MIVDSRTETFVWTSLLKSFFFLFPLLRDSSRLFPRTLSQYNIICSLESVEQIKKSKVVANKRILVNLLK